MLMRGDLQKLFDQINPVFETAFARIDELEKKVKELEARETPVVEPPKKRPGRPKKEPEEAKVA